MRALTCATHTGTHRMCVRTPTFHLHRIHNPHWDRWLLLGMYHTEVCSTNRKSLQMNLAPLKAAQQSWNLQSFIYLTNKNSTDSWCSSTVSLKPNLALTSWDGQECSSFAYNTETGTCSAELGTRPPGDRGEVAGLSGTLWEDLHTKPQEQEGSGRSTQKPRLEEPVLISSSPLSRSSLKVISQGHLTGSSLSFANPKTRQATSERL